MVGSSYGIWATPTENGVQIKSLMKAAFLPFRSPNWREGTTSSDPNFSLYITQPTVIHNSIPGVPKSSSSQMGI